MCLSCVFRVYVFEVLEKIEFVLLTNVYSRLFMCVVFCW